MNGQLQITPERELELLKEDFEALNETIQAKVDSAVNTIVYLLNQNDITPGQAHETMAGVFYALNGLDKSNYLANLLKAMNAEKVGQGADVAAAGDYLVLRVQKDSKLKVVQVVREIEMPTGLEESQSLFRKVINNLRAKKHAN